MLAVLRAKSSRCLWTFRYPFARCFLALLRLLLFFCLPQMARVLNAMPLRVREKGGETQVNAGGDARWLMHDLALGPNPKLDIVPIGTTDNPNALDLREREGFDVLRGIAHQSQASDARAIREREVPAVRFQSPACRFVLYRAVVMLELGIAFLARLLVLTVLIEPLDSKPGARGRGLSCLRVEPLGERVVGSKNGALALQIVLVRPSPIHPTAQALVPDELDNPYRLLDGGVLSFAPVEFVFVDQHAAYLPVFIVCRPILYLYPKSGTPSSPVIHAGDEGVLSCKVKQNNASL
jgi:hypothetical protein